MKGCVRCASLPSKTMACPRVYLWTQASLAMSQGRISLKQRSLGQIRSKQKLTIVASLKNSTLKVGSPAWPRVQVSLIREELGMQRHQCCGGSTARNGRRSKVDMKARCSIGARALRGSKSLQNRFAMPCCSQALALTYDYVLAPVAGLWGLVYASSFLANFRQRLEMNKTSSGLSDHE